jgi:large subunit ribosomal protein L41
VEKGISRNFCCKIFAHYFFILLFPHTPCLYLFFSYNKRGTRIFKKERHLSNPDIPIEKRGVRDTGKIVDGKFQMIPEMIPELIVPDLTDCKFKPYVCYKSAEVVQSEFTSQDLFNAVYADKIIDDFKNDKLNEDGTSKNPSEFEELTSEEAWAKARKTGSDIF